MNRDDLDRLFQIHLVRFSFSGLFCGCLAPIGPESVVLFAVGIFHEARSLALTFAELTFINIAIGVGGHSVSVDLTRTP